MVRETKVASFIDSRVLARNTILNFAGLVLPLGVALLCVPLLVNRMGTDRFGVLALAWVIAGYFSLFDLGLGRALTKLVAERLGKTSEYELSTLVWTAVALTSMLGILGAVVLWAATPWLTSAALKIPSELRGEASIALQFTALSIPIAVSTSCIRGVLEAKQRFDIVNAIRIPFGALTFIGPVCALPFSVSLVPAAVILFTIRIIGAFATVGGCFVAMPSLKDNVKFQIAAVRELIKFGMWLTVTNIISPVMTYFDRFVIAMTISASAVAYYSTPYDLVTRLWVVPAALGSALFPAFAATIASNLRERRAIFTSGTAATFLAAFPATFLVIIYADEVMTLWIGSVFAAESFKVLRWLALGVFINCLAQIAFTLIQGLGRPDFTAKLHLVEAPFYVLLLLFLLGRMGIEGAAIAWTVRVAVDALVLFVKSWKLVGEEWRAVSRQIAIIFVSLMALGIAMEVTQPTLKALFSAGVLLFFIVLIWLVCRARSPMRRNVTGFRSGTCD